MREPSFRFPAISGVQAGTQYFITMVPLGTLAKLFMFSDEELPPDVRAQRVLNRGRIPEIRDYITNNTNSYVFSALTASVDGPIEFEPINNETSSKIGMVTIPMTARFIINDGQHRKAAIEAAIKQKPLLKYEDISIVLYCDMGLKKSQQIFSDLNRHAIRPTKSLNILFDNRNDFSSMVCDMVDTLPIFKGWVEKERSTIPNRSKALFTLSGIYHGTEELFSDCPKMKTSQKKKIACDFWTTVGTHMPDWRLVTGQHIKASQLRKDSVSAHAITLIAIGRVGNELLRKYNDFYSQLERLSEIDWSKKNPEWIGKVVIEDHISGTRSSTQALTDAIRKTIMEER